VERVVVAGEGFLRECMPKLELRVRFAAGELRGKGIGDAGGACLTTAGAKQECDRQNQ
jgi:hypothetical protein